MQVIELITKIELLLSKIGLNIIQMHRKIVNKNTAISYVCQDKDGLISRKTKGLLEIS